MLYFLFPFFLIHPVFATITDDFSCTSDGTYTNTATACSNNFPDDVCEQLYPETTPGAGYPGAWNSVRRPFLCTGDTEPKPDLKAMAIQNCPKTCAFCCLTPAYNCSNAPYPRINCKTVTPNMCQSPTWRKILSEDCPSVCGLCKPSCVFGPDLTTSCTAWAAQGFCNNEFYTYEQRKLYCPSTCKLC